MINLLLPADRKVIRAEYRHRLFIVSGLLTFGLALVALIIVSSFAFILSLRRAEVLEQIASAHRGFASDELVMARRTTGEINNAVKVLAAKPLHEPISTIYRRLIEKRGPGIRLTHLEFAAASGATVAVEGKSSTRAALLAYLAALRAEAYFQTVESPIKNIIREHDLTFNLTVTLAPAK